MKKKSLGIKTCVLFSMLTIGPGCEMPRISVSDSTTSNAGSGVRPGVGNEDQGDIEIDIQDVDPTGNKKDREAYARLRPTGSKKLQRARFETESVRLQSASISLFDNEDDAAEKLEAHIQYPSENYALFKPNSNNFLILPQDDNAVLLLGEVTPSAENGDESYAPKTLASGSTQATAVSVPEFSITGSGAAVSRYVANDNMPIFSSASANAGHAQMLNRGDRVLVFDSLPVYSGSNVFVEVQAADEAPHAVGYMPLSWLYQTPVSTQETRLGFSASYGLISKALSKVVDRLFYSQCSGYPVYPHSIFENPTVKPGQVQSANYGCGEYPVGDTSNSGDKLLGNATIVTPAYSNEGVFDVDIQPIPLDIPVYMSGLSGQRRGDSYAIRNLSSGFYSQAGQPDMTDHFVYARYPNEEEQSFVESENAVRIHDTDFWFNVSLEAPVGINSNALAYFTSCFYLPGVELRTGIVETDIDFETENKVTGKKRSSHIDGIDFGRLTVSRYRVCATAAIKETVTPVSNQGFASDWIATNFKSDYSLQFVSAKVSDIELQHQGGIDIYGELDGFHDVIFDALHGVLANILSNGIDFGIPGVGSVDFDGLGPFLWAAAFKTSIEGELLAVLGAMATAVNAILPSPDDVLANACGEIFPASYKSPASPFYPLWQQCQQATLGADVELVSNNPVNGAVCYKAGNFARVNDGKSWSNDEDWDDMFYFGDDEYYVVDRPFWTSCGVESTLETAVMSAYVPLLTCISEVTERDLNYDKGDQLRGDLRNECEVPAVKMLCDTIGDGEDLREIWAARFGSVPNVKGLFNFCALYEQLSAEPCTPTTCL